MTFDKTSLPTPPDFPASNASYSKIAGKMHKAVLGSTTAAAAISAVEMIKEHVKGVNTYAKKVRRYGDDLITALGGEVAAATGTATGTGGASGEPAAKRASPRAHGRLNKKTGEVKMVGLTAATGADKPAIPLGERLLANAGEEFLGRKFSSKSNAKRALKAAQLDHLPIEWQPADNDYVRPVLTVTDDKGLAYAAERGFAAKVAA